MVVTTYHMPINLLSGDREPVFPPPSDAENDVEYVGWLERERRAGQWREASAEVIRLPVANLQLEQAINAVAQGLRKVAGADYAGIALIDQARPDSFVVESVSGLGLEHTAGTRIPLRHVAAAAGVVESGRTVVAGRPPVDDGYEPLPEWSKAFEGLGTAMVAPLSTDVRT